MERLGNFAQNYTQAPWRKQLQFAGLFSLALVVVALVAGVYLSVSARSATVGRHIQDMQREIDGLDNEIEDLQSRLAVLMSSGSMEERARSLGFERINAEETIYLSVEGYAGKQPLRLAPYITRTAVEARGIPPEYTESVFTWLERQVVTYVVSASEVQP
jgi:cell division protein FtsL